MARYVMACVATAGMLLSGCARVPGGYNGELSDADIINKLPEARAESVAEVKASIGTSGATAAPTRTVTQETATQGFTDVAVLTGPPGPAQASAPLASAEGGAITLGASDAKQAQSSVLIDAMVGQINGRPVYASEFFGPMDARLRADAARMPPEQWLRTTREQINKALRERVRDELLLAEFEASLSPEQKSGLLAFMRSLRSNLISENRGSEAQAQELYGKEGSTVDDKVREQRDRELIGMQVRQAVVDRVYVSWREVQQEYERNYEKYNPPGSARLRMIWVKKSDEAKLARVAEALEAGEAFADVATRESEFNRKEGGLHEAVLKGATYEESRIFDPPALNEKATALRVGEVIGPFEHQGRMVWMLLESVDKKQLSLFDTQLEVHSALWAQQFDEESKKYFERLVEHGSLTDMNKMSDRLFEIAAHRYLIAGTK